MGLIKQELVSLVTESVKKAYYEVTGVDTDRSLLLNDSEYLDDYSFTADFTGTIWEEKGVYSLDYANGWLTLNVDLDYFYTTQEDIEGSGVIAQLGIEKRAEPYNAITYRDYFSDEYVELFCIQLISTDKARKSGHTVFAYFESKEYVTKMSLSLNLDFDDDVIIDFGKHFFNGRSKVQDSDIEMDMLQHYRNCEVHCDSLSLYEEDLTLFKELHIDLTVEYDWNLWFKAESIQTDIVDRVGEVLKELGLLDNKDLSSTITLYLLFEKRVTKRYINIVLDRLTHYYEQYNTVFNIKLCQLRTDKDVYDNDVEILNTGNGMIAYTTRFKGI